MAFPKLQILTGPEEGQEIALTDKPSLRLGRSDASDFILADTSVSRHHCAIIYKDGHYHVKDDGSRNGTYFEDEKLLSHAEIKLKHLDLIRVGIYEIRFLEKAFSEKDLQDKANVSASVIDKPVAVKPEPESEEIQLKNNPKTPEPEKETEAAKKENATDISEKLVEQDQEELSGVGPEPLPVFTETRAGKNLNIIFISAVSMCVIVVLSYFFYQQSLRKTEKGQKHNIEVIKQKPIEKNEPKEELSKSSPEVAKAVVESKSPVSLPTEIKEPAKEIVKEENLPVSVLPEAQAPQTTPEFNVFLDIKTQPLPAVIYYQDKRLGQTPLKQSISVKPDGQYEIFSDFELRDLHDIYRKKVAFKAKPDTDVVELNINAEIGTLKILKLPKRVEFYLEGFYAYDKLKSNPVKITDITYGKPIYLPYGRYVVELREKTKIAGSDNEITEIRFQREYEINEKNHTLELSVTDKDLQFFPAVIKSNPSNAVVYYGDEKVGNTPYQGSLPLGANKIKISKDGYFDSLIDIDMRMNSIYETTVTLQTSKMGELINQAKEQIRNEQTTEAISTLVDALKYGGSGKEKAEVYYMLGNIYLSQSSYDQARPYFEKARIEPDFANLGTLGLVQVYNGLNSPSAALPLLVEVLANIDEKTPLETKNAANSIFKKISPFKSVIYIYTDPAGASVFVNDKKLGQASPLILSELALGNYRIEIDKPGFEPFKTTQNLKLGEFVTLKVQLKPEQL